MNKQINHLWRVIATGICFTFFGLGGLFLTVFIFPVQKLFYKGSIEQNRAARKTVHYTFKFFIGLMSFTGVFKYSLQKVEKLKHLHGHLIMANHPSLIDVVVLISIIPNADCVVKAHLFKNPFIRGVVKNTGYISNAQPEGLLQDCKASLAEGNNLIIFPEGTRTKPGQKIKFQRGAANIAIRCQAPVTSVLIKVEPTTLTKSEPWYKVPDKKAHFSAQIIDDTPEIPKFNAADVSKEVRTYTSLLESYFKNNMLMS